MEKASIPTSSPNFPEIYIGSQIKNHLETNPRNFSNVHSPKLQPPGIARNSSVSKQHISAVSRFVKYCCWSKFQISFSFTSFFVLLLASSPEKKSCCLLWLKTKKHKEPGSKLTCFTTLQTPWTCCQIPYESKHQTFKRYLLGPQNHVYLNTWTHHTRLWIFNPRSFSWQISHHILGRCFFAAPTSARFDGITRVISEMLRHETKNLLVVFHWDLYVIPYYI